MIIPYPFPPIDCEYFTVIAGGCAPDCPIYDCVLFCKQCYIQDSSGNNVQLVYQHCSGPMCVVYAW